MEEFALSCSCGNADHGVVCDVEDLALRPLDDVLARAVHARVRREGNPADVVEHVARLVVRVSLAFACAGEEANTLQILDNLATYCS